MVVIRAAIASLLVLASACTVGEVPPAGSTPTPDAAGPTPTADAKVDGAPAQSPDESFTANVVPLIAACRQCHQGGQAPNLSSATTLDAKYKVKPGSSSPLVNHGMHAGSSGSVLSDTQRTAIVTWLDSL